MARQRARIYRAAPGDWRVVKPRAGFGPTTEEISYPSWQEATKTMVFIGAHYVSNFESEIRTYRIADHAVRGVDGDWRD